MTTQAETIQRLGAPARRGRSLPISREWELVQRTVGGLAHELNNQLAPILLNLTVLRAKLDPEDHQTLELLRKGIRKSSRLIRQLEWVLKRESVDPEECDLRLVLRAFEGSLARSPRNVRISAELPEGDLTITGDPVSLLHAFESLGQLCCNSNPGVPPWLQMTVEPVGTLVEDLPQDQSWLVVCITHPGESASVAEFKSLGQTSVSKRGSSLRLGVDLVALDSGIRDHGGWIEIEKLQGPLTQYRIYLPTSPSEALSKSSELLSEEHETSSIRGQCPTSLILIAEDEPAIRRVIRTLLELRGHSLVICKNGQEALAAFREHSSEIGVVLTDVSMPQMGGVELGRRLREIAPEVPLVYMTGASEDKANAKGLGGSREPVLSKPFSASDLYSVLETAMSRRGQ